MSSKGPIIERLLSCGTKHLILWKKTLVWPLLLMGCISLFIICDSPHANYELSIKRPMESVGFVCRWIDAYLFLMIPTLLAIFLLVSFARHNYSALIIVAICGLAFIEASVITCALKVIYSRPAPMIALNQNIDDGFYGYNGLNISREFSSYPSGHAAISFAVATVVLLRMGKVWGTIFIIFAEYASLYKVYIGDHYLTDVIGGAIVGIYCGYICCSSISSSHSDPQ